MKSENYPVNKPMLVAGIGYIVLFIFLIIAKNHFPDAGGGWSDPPIVDHIFFLGAGICTSILGLGYSYYSWILTEEEYIRWYTDQQLIGKRFINLWRRLYPSGTIIWMNRIIYPVFAFIGFAMVAFALAAIFNFIF